MPYAALQQILDEANAWGFHTYDKGTYLEDLSDQAIKVVARRWQVAAGGRRTRTGALSGAPRFALTAVRAMGWW
jgi:hypothetical protein